MIRTMIESLLTDKSGYGKRTLRKDIGRMTIITSPFIIPPLDYNHLSIIEQFHKQSFFWDYLLNFDGIGLLSLIFRSLVIILCSS